MYKIVDIQRCFLIEEQSQGMSLNIYLCLMNFNGCYRYFPIMIHIRNGNRIKKNKKFSLLIRLFFLTITSVKECEVMHNNDFKVIIKTLHSIHPDLKDKNFIKPEGS